LLVANFLSSVGHNSTAIWWPDRDNRYCAAGPLEVAAVDRETTMTLLLLFFAYSASGFFFYH